MTHKQTTGNYSGKRKTDNVPAIPEHGMSTAEAVKALKKDHRTQLIVKAEKKAQEFGWTGPWGGWKAHSSFYAEDPSREIRVSFNLKYGEDVLSGGVGWASLGVQEMPKTKDFIKTLEQAVEIAAIFKEPCVDYSVSKTVPRRKALATDKHKPLHIQKRLRLMRKAAAKAEQLGFTATHGENAGRTFSASNKQGDVTIFIREPYGGDQLHGGINWAAKGTQDRATTKRFTTDLQKAFKIYNVLSEIVIDT